MLLSSSIAPSAGEVSMRALVTGSSGHLGEALVRTLKELGYEVIGLDILKSPFTTCVGSIIDRSCVRRCMIGVQAVFHAATLHKPHLATHRRQNFVDTNITGTMNLLEEAVTAGVESFVYTARRAPLATLSCRLPERLRHG